VLLRTTFDQMGAFDPNVIPSLGAAAGAEG